MPVNKRFSDNNEKVVIFYGYFKKEIVAVRHNSRPAIPLDKLFSAHHIGVEVDTLPVFYLVGASGGRYTENVKHFMTVEPAIDVMLRGDVHSVVAPRS